MRYIQHTHINNQVIKLEIFKFLLNSYEVIEKLLNTKILNCLLEVKMKQNVFFKKTFYFFNAISDCNKRLGQ